MHFREPVLPGAKEITGPAQPQILLRDFKAIVGFGHDLQTGAVFLPIIVGDKDTPALVFSSPDTPAQLMELAQAKALSVLHHDQRRVWNVHADFNYCSCHKNICFSSHHGGHDRLFVLCFHFSMDTGYTKLWKLLLQGFGVFFGAFELLRHFVVLFYHGTDHKNLPSLAHQLANKAVEPGAIALVHSKGVHLLPSGRQLINDRDIKIAVYDKGKCARDRRSRHDKHMGLLSLADQRRALPDPEAVLLVSDNESQSVIFHIRAEQGMCADHQVEAPAFQFIPDKPLFLCRHRPGELSHPQPERPQKLCQRVEMLLCQDFGRGHKSGHITVFCTMINQRCRDQGLAAAHVSLYQPVHHRAGIHVAHGIFYRAFLRPGRRKGQRRPETFQVSRCHTDSRFA